MKSLLAALTVPFFLGAGELPPSPARKPQEGPAQMLTISPVTITAVCAPPETLENFASVDNKTPHETGLISGGKVMVQIWRNDVGEFGIVLSTPEHGCVIYHGEGWSE